MACFQLAQSAVVLWKFSPIGSCEFEFLIDTAIVEFFSKKVICSFLNSELQLQIKCWDRPDMGKVECFILLILSLF